ncbi:MAG TPA: hypothetical protein VEB22_11700 [Phycisphaerales bacterium]|nr:hypothetical protein [Phycisphaerales bacterium]
MRCCNDVDRAAPAVLVPSADVERRPGMAPRVWVRRGATLFQWALPLTTLVLIPKCPACVAGYVLLFTGVGLSFPAAATVRWVLIALSVVALAFLALRAARRAFAPSV